MWLASSSASYTSLILIYCSTSTSSSMKLYHSFRICVQYGYWFGGKLIQKLQQKEIDKESCLKTCSMNWREDTLSGKRFAFVRFIKVGNVDHLVENLCTLWIGRAHLHANVGRYDRPPISSSRPNVAPRPTVKSVSRPSANGALVRV
ncbi:hypothetical protein Tco_0695418 [Tanacetum coccineum]